MVPPVRLFHDALAQTTYRGESRCEPGATGLDRATSNGMDFRLGPRFALFSMQIRKADRCHNRFRFVRSASDAIPCLVPRSGKS